MCSILYFNQLFHQLEGNRSPDQVIWANAPNRPILGAIWQRFCGVRVGYGFLDFYSSWIQVLGMSLGFGSSPNPFSPVYDLFTYFYEGFLGSPFPVTHLHLECHQCSIFGVESRGKADQDESKFQCLPDDFRSGKSKSTDPCLSFEILGWLVSHKYLFPWKSPIWPFPLGPWNSPFR